MILIASPLGVMYHACTSTLQYDSVQKKIKCPALPIPKMND